MKRRTRRLCLLLRNFIARVNLFGYKRRNASHHILLIGPPRSGKTTLQRTWEVGNGAVWEERFPTLLAGEARQVTAQTFVTDVGREDSGPVLHKVYRERVAVAYVIDGARAELGVCGLQDHFQEVRTWCKGKKWPLAVVLNKRDTWKTCEEDVLSIAIQRLRLLETGFNCIKDGLGIFPVSCKDSEDTKLVFDALTMERLDRGTMVELL